jgi:hypothetical protein
MASVLQGFRGMQRLLLSIGTAALIIGIIASPQASAQQSAEIFIGGFLPHSLDARGTDDVLFQNSTFLSTFNRSNGIDINQFNNVTIGGEWLTRLGPFFEAGLGVSFFQRTVPTTYTNFVNTDGSEITQDLKLRIVPFSATVRVVPFGHAPVEPYFGGGVNIYAWRYSETGQFIDNSNNIITGSFSGSGGAVGPVILGGVRFPFGPVAAGGEIRWQGGHADLPTDQGFAGGPNPKIDLGGVSYLFVIDVRF